MAECVFCTSRESRCDRESCCGSAGMGSYISRFLGWHSPLSGHVGVAPIKTPSHVLLSRLLLNKLGCFASTKTGTVQSLAGGKRWCHCDRRYGCMRLSAGSLLAGHTIGVFVTSEIVLTPRPTPCEQLGGREKA